MPLGMKPSPLTIGAEWSSATSARSRPNGISGLVSGVQIELENVWGRMKTSICRRSFHGSSADGLWAAVNEEWERLKCDSSFTEALYRSLRDRMKAIVDAQGDVTRY
ncbi:hypothetical protein MTO96_015798 [Rhipicephalus appendiculatus]